MDIAKNNTMVEAVHILEECQVRICCLEHIMTHGHTESTYILHHLKCAQTQEGLQRMKKDFRRDIRRARQGLPVHKRTAEVTTGSSSLLATESVSPSNAEPRSIPLASDSGYATPSMVVILVMATLVALFVFRSVNGRLKRQSLLPETSPKRKY